MYTLQVALALIVLWSCACSMRVLKESPVVWADRREFKSAAFPLDTVRNVPALRVRVHCTESTMEVRVHADLYPNWVRAADLRLGPRGASGSCTPVPRAAADDVYDDHVISANLHECGATVRVEDQSLVYSNTLFHNPTPNRFGIIRTENAAIPVECHFHRVNLVSSRNQPLVRNTAVKRTSAAPIFDFQLSNDDWSSGIPSSMIQSGNVINMAASVLSPGDSKFKLFLDSCVATLEPDVTTPQYDIIHNHGCPAAYGSARTGVSFLPRKEDHVLHFQLDLPHAIKSPHSPATTIYITCWLKARDAAQEENSLNKACSYSGNSWQSADGKHEVCECCDWKCDLTNQRQRTKRVPKSVDSFEGESSAVLTVGPIILH